MRRPKEPQELHRKTRFETFEERLALSAQSVVDDFQLEAHTGQQLDHHYGDLAPAEALSPIGDFNLNLGVTSPGDNGSQGVQTQLQEAHALTGVNDAYGTYGFDGAGQTVAIIDSGIAYDHLALGGGFGTSYRVVGGWDFAENDANPYDDGPAGFHGTHVAGIVGSDDTTHRGVASGADLVALRVFDDNGAGYFSWVEDALQWVHDNRDAFQNPITTVNLSLGTSWNADSIPSWAMLEDEFSQLEQDGIFIAVSAGNSFQDYNEPGLSYPAASPFVVPVASVDDSGILSYFSQRSDRILAAPGRSITSTVPDFIFGADGNPNDFGTASGTSMAAPYTAGASVLVRQAMEMVGIQNITQDMIYDHFRATADVFYDATTSASYHRINVQAALDDLMPVDDYGSTVATAHSLGVITGETSLSGRIGTLDDIDYFTFTAGETGSASFTVDASQNLVAEFELVGGGAETVGSAITFDVVAGESYTLFVQTADGLGSYNADLDLEAIAVPEPIIVAAAVNDATTWSGSEAIARTARFGDFFGDDLVSVDVTESYQLSGWARSGNDEGGQYQANNRQYFGFASYDIDANIILPQHVQKVVGAADTRLAQTLRPGDTQIVLEDASGWSDTGAAHERSFAWYGYSNSTGQVYEDYTYTRNVKFNDTWDIGAIDYQTNTITLRTAWDGPELDAGEAVRNAQSGGTYNYAALSAQGVSNEWTNYNATISGVSSTDATSFRPGTAYIKSVVLSNYHGQDGNLISWKDVEVRPADSFAGGGQVDLSVATLDMPNVTYAWTQLTGPAVNILNANTARATFTTPNQLVDSELTFQVTASDGEFEITDTVAINVDGDSFPVDAQAVLDATTWSGSEDLAAAAQHGDFFGDDFVSVDVTESYQLSGWARSGNDAGGEYQASNRQYFGFASYDIDQNIILPQHVGKVEDAADTRLAQTLRAGDAQIVLEDVSGWSNTGAAHQRSFAWYNYSDSTGNVYDDYTYTRNVKFKEVWDVGAINYETNTITLRTAWDGPELSTGAAVRNAQSGGTYNYASLSGTAISNEWTQYNATISGVSSTEATRFRPGTAYIKSLVLTNYHGQDGNLITWKDVEVRPDSSFAAGGQVQLSVAADDLSNVTYVWTQLSGPAVEILNANTATASFVVPEGLADAQLSFQVTVGNGSVDVTDTVNVSILGDEPNVNVNATPDAFAGNLNNGHLAYFGIAGNLPQGSFGQPTPDLALPPSVIDSAVAQPGDSHRVDELFGHLGSPRWQSSETSSSGDSHLTSGTRRQFEEDASVKFQECIASEQSIPLQASDDDDGSEIFVLDGLFEEFEEHAVQPQD